MNNKIVREENLLKFVNSDYIFSFKNRIKIIKELIKIDSKYQSLYDNLVESCEKYVDCLLISGLVKTTKKYKINKSFILNIMENNELKYASALVIYENYLEGYDDNKNLDKYFFNYLEYKFNEKSLKTVSKATLFRHLK